MHVCTCAPSSCARVLQFCEISVAQSVQDMSGTITAIGLGVVACGLSVVNWIWSPAPIAVPEPISVELPTASPAEFACSCSCPTPSAQVVSVLAPQSGWSWSAYGLLISVFVWLLSAWCFCRARATQTVVYEAPVYHHGGPLALHDSAESSADRRALHVRGLRRGGGAMA